MKRRCYRQPLWAALLLSVMCSAGCVVAADLLNPDLAATLGVTAVPQRTGSIVVRYSNTSNFSAVFASQWSDDPSDLTSNFASVPSGAVAPNDAFNFVIDCPVGVWQPRGIVGGISSNDLNATSATVVVVGADGTVNVLDIPFAGAALQSGTDFLCGDLIEVRLVQIGAGAAATDYVIRVQVIPGR